MTFFFLVVGLEAKRELDIGELRDRRRLAIPVVAAVGGMAVPIAIFLAFNAGGAGAHGWGAAMSTDTAFALGVAGAGGPGRHPPAGSPAHARGRRRPRGAGRDRAGLHGARLARSRSRSPPACSGSLFALRYAPASWRRQAAVLVGVGVWVALFESGVDPVISGLAVGLVTSAYPPTRTDLERVTELTRSFREQPTPELARSAQLSVASAISPNERLQYRLHPWTSFVIVPLFALANAGIHVDGAAARRRRHLAGDARDHGRLRGRQAARHRRRVVARVAIAGSPACAGP